MTKTNIDDWNNPNARMQSIRRINNMTIPPWWLIVYGLLLLAIAFLASKVTCS